ncbi:MAG: hypothetical protein JXA93_22605 [Anaerolineae bacterium]|nr:hypothetical protein [Anaerolineae bacterium]
MSQTTRIIIAVVILLVVIGAVFGIEMVRRNNAAVEGEATLVPGAIPIYWNGELVASFSPQDLETLEQASFVDAEEGKTQEGWMLRDVLRLHLDADQLDADTPIVVSSSSRGKGATLTWAEVEDTNNWVMFDLAGRGTLKLVSTLERLDVRDEWIQDVDRIEVGRP